MVRFFGGVLLSSIGFPFVLHGLVGFFPLEKQEEKT
jgi:hypothetical protein